MKEGRVIIDAAADQIDQYYGHQDFKSYLQPMSDGG
jgi:hypothetical protein